MKKCILCGETDEATVEEHHTIPRSINSNWKKKIFLCQKCHEKVHRYILPDLIEVVTELRGGYLFIIKIFEDTGFPRVEGLVGDTHKRIIKYLLDNLPLSEINGKISVAKMAQEIMDPGGDIRKERQRAGYILRKLRIKTHHERRGKYIYYDTDTISRLGKLERMLFKK